MNFFYSGKKKKKDKALKKKKKEPQGTEKTNIMLSYTISYCQQ